MYFGSIMKPLFLILAISIVAILPGCTKTDNPVENDEIAAGSGIEINIERSEVDRIIDLLYQADTSYVMVVSHRGDWLHAPENTLEAIQLCIDLGVEIVEIDVRQTVDEHLVVIHDSSLDRTTNGTGRVDEHTLAYIQTLKNQRSLWKYH